MATDLDSRHLSAMLSITLQAGAGMTETNIPPVLPLTREELKNTVTHPGPPHRRATPLYRGFKTKKTRPTICGAGLILFHFYFGKMLAMSMVSSITHLAFKLNHQNLFISALLQNFSFESNPR